MAQQCAKWIDDETIFPDFVSALYNFTFTSYGALAFTEKLAIWHPIIKSLSNGGFDRYSQTMHLLVSNILRKVQFRFEADLSELDNECLDDDVMLALL